MSLSIKPFIHCAVTQKQLMREREQRNPWALIPSQSKCAKVSLSLPSLWLWSCLHVHPPGQHPPVLCYAKSWHFPASCLGLLPPRVQSAAHAAGCKQSCLHRMYSSAVILFEKDFSKSCCTMASSPFLWPKSGKLYSIVVLAFLSYADSGKSVWFNLVHTSIYTCILPILS